MKSQTKKRILKKAKKAAKIFLLIIILSIIVLSYGMGIIKGGTVAMALTANKYNHSMCELMNKTRDTDGFCILKEGAIYTQYIDCGWEKFKTIGNKKPGFIEHISFEIQSWIYYPSLGCN